MSLRLTERSDPHVPLPRASRLWSRSDDPCLLIHCDSQLSLSRPAGGWPTHDGRPAKAKGGAAGLLVRSGEHPGPPGDRPAGPCEGVSNKEAASTEPTRRADPRA
jgi:hypothetical protein